MRCSNPDVRLRNAPLVIQVATMCSRVTWKTGLVPLLVAWRQKAGKSTRPYSLLMSKEIIIIITAPNNGMFGSKLFIAQMPYIFRMSSGQFGEICDNAGHAESKI